jgi:hypothetical protein
MLNVKINESSDPPTVRDKKNKMNPKKMEGRARKTVGKKDK